MKCRIILLLGLLLSGVQSCRQPSTQSHDTYVVMVSFDGFRWDYAQHAETPNLDALATNGVKAERMIPSFPTKTFPNHFTLASGLYPDNHGIINNSFYAPDLGEIYRIGNDMVLNGDAYFGEPIWVTAEKQGVKSASYFWVGSEAPIQGIYPSYLEKYNESIPYEDRVDQVIDWLTLPLEERPGFVLLYFDEPDGTGHDVGPGHPNTVEVVEYLDSVLGYLQKGLSALPYGDRVNLIVLSDHGMGSISPDRYVNLSDHIREEWTAQVIGGNPLYLIEPAEGYQDSITTALNGVDGLSAWSREDIPQRLNYGKSIRFPGIVVVADSLWSIGTSADPSGYSGGAHGYDNQFSGMHSIFYADGPAFKDGYTQPAFPNVDVYSIVSNILGLDPAQTDGDLDRVKGMFRSGQ